MQSALVFMMRRFLQILCGNCECLMHAIVSLAAPVAILTRSANKALFSQE